METSTKDFMPMESLREMASMNGAMEPYIEANSKTELDMAMDNGATVKKYMRANTSMIKGMGKVSTNGMEVVIIRVSLLMI